MKHLMTVVLLLCLCLCLLASCVSKPETPAASSSPEESSEAQEETEAVSEESSLPPEEAIMAYEIPDNYFDTYTDDFGVTEYLPMKVSCANGQYTISHKDSDGGIWTVTMVRKQWGVWMLGAMNYLDCKGKNANIMAASTDYEWVLGCGATAGTVTFRGGNHGDYANQKWNPEDSSTGNDRMLDMTLYDGKTGKKLEPAIGETVQTDGLRIVIHTNIYDGEYTKENVLICDEKLYLFNGLDVNVQSHLALVKDTYFTTSYTCMFPVFKKFGNYAMFFNDDGSYKTVKTPVNGKNNYGNVFDEKNVASRVEFWGEQEPAYHMSIRIYNPEDQFYKSALHTRLWDMNPSSNKLYFSAFSGTPTRVPKGTQWTYRSSWSFSYLPDFVCPDTADVQIGF